MWIVAISRGVTIAVFCSGLAVVALAQDKSETVSAVRCGSIERIYQLSPRLYCGSRPSTAEDFAELARLGIHWIVSVDGIPPDVDAARTAGLRYIHIPLDYGSIETDQTARLIRAVEAAPGPVYIHCHHGKYRGPAAAAQTAGVLEAWPRERVAAWLSQAGLIPEEYPDLYASAIEPVKPDRATLDAIDPALLPDRAPVPDLVERMVEIDALWMELKEIAPDAVGEPALARQLGEQFRESARREESRRYGPDLIRSLETAAKAAFAVEAAWRDRQPAAAEREAVARSCVECHRAYRNRDRATR
jgi:protein tyrosine phosphatase (PTP) superfamily phosphohydrolase (DUF442 family)